MRIPRGFLMAATLAAGACAGPSAVRGPSYGSDFQSSVVTPRGDRIPAGSRFWVELDSRIGQDSRPGERFSARLGQPVVAPDGQVLLPAGTRVIGHVEQVHEGVHGSDEAVIVLRLDELQVGGMRQPITASIVATQPRGGGASTHVDKEDVLIGAGLGAIIGGIAEGGEGVIVGGLLGAGAGTAVSLGKNYESGPRALEPGSALQVQLEKPVLHVAATRGRVY